MPPNSDAELLPNSDTELMPLTSLRTKCLMKSTAYQGTHEWKIENISHYSRNYIYGPLFSPQDGLKDTDLGWKWSLELKAKHRPHPNLDAQFVALYLRMHPTERGQNSGILAKAIYTFALLGPNGDIAYSIELGHSITFSPLVTLSWGRHQFISWDELLQNRDQLIPNDTLTVYVKIRSLTDFETQFKIAENFSGIVRSPMNQDFTDLLLSGDYADVKFIITDLMKEEFEIPAHKVILLARFPYAARLINENNNIETINIRGFQADVFAEVLIFVYTEKVVLDQELAVRLLAAAEKFELHQLKQICEKTLLINVKNVANLLIKANAYKAAKLKAKCIAFIRKNPRPVMDTAGWGLLMTCKPEYVKDIFDSNF